ncbi:peptide ABC transporter substrate-binding protein [Trichococcus ilyis]|uniref:Oligopeptide transport system substrate-binding protein n=1 Tax=Trichococcus ilyis TaxID=640938 RepID=A0A143Y7C9_9LACT|nr:peptide ABC transporter substrate-binding protein [Trichococcus ilyis]CZQ81291.1 Hypothetical protein TR210_124 [Trichococcus ilyis]SEI53471.1 oligopeptide transport system substrate-binding protein [Trichococcus ilyis]
MRRLKSSFILATTAVILAACGGDGATDDSATNTASSGAGGQVLHYTAPTELATLDTTLMTDINSSNYISHTIEGLLKINEDGKPVPAIAAEAGTVSEDGLMYTYKLREDAVWSNGEPVTANDFVFAWRRLVDPEAGASYAYLAETIKNANEIMAGEMEPEELGVTAVSDNEITIELTQPTPYFESLLAFSAFFPQNEAFVTEKGDKYGTSSENILANGPFTIENWDGTGLTWDLVKNEDYYAAEEVQLDEVDVQVIKETSTVVNLFQQGSVDNAQVTGELVKQLASDPNVVVQKKARTAYIEFNHDNVYLQNAKLRKAIGLVINRDELVDSVIGDGSTAIGGFLPADFVSNPTTGEDFAAEAGSYLDYDLEQAKTLWAEAKAELGVDKITFSLVGDDDEKNKKISQYIQGQIQNNLEGITVELRNVPKKNRLELANQDEFDLLQTGWGADFADAINYMDLLYSTSAYNEGQYANAAFDALIDLSKTTDANNPEARWADLMAAHKLIMEDAAIIPLYQEAETQLRNPKVKGIIFNSVGNEFDLSRAYIEE